MKEKTKQVIMELVNDFGGDVSFVELVKEFEAEGVEYKGDNALKLGGENVYAWMGMSQETIEAVFELLEGPEPASERRTLI